MNNLFSSLVQFWDLARPFKRQLATVCALLCFDGLLAASSVVSIAPMADLVLERPQEDWIVITTKVQQIYEFVGIPFSLLSVTLLFFLITLSIALYSVIVRRAMVKMQVTVTRHLIDQCLESMLNADWRYFSSTKRGELNNTYIRETNRTAGAFKGLTQGVASIVKIISFVSVPILIQPVLVLICLVATLSIAVPFLYLGKWSYRFGSRNLKFVNRYSSLLRESIEAAREVISFGKERETARQISMAYKRAGDAQITAATFNTFSTRLFEPIGILIIITTLLVGKEFTEGFAISSMAVVLWGLVRSIAPIRQLIRLKFNFDKTLPSLQQVKREQTRANSFRQTPGTRFTELASRTVEFEDVHFEYQENARGLAGCSFQAGENQFVALVGESGSGKSTIIDMILGLQRPASGAVYLNGIDSREIDLARWREGLSLVPQKPVLFDLSIRKNLLWANPEATDEEVWRVCEVADAARFIEQMPKDLDSKIGDAGMRLSGGQLQRIALARALIRKPEILILDEATSALDMETEARIYNALFRETRDCLVFIVAHRLSTIANADKILVFQEGKLIEQGNYQELMSQPGYFRKLVQSQPDTKPDTPEHKAMAHH